MRAISADRRAGRRSYLSKRRAVVGSGVIIAMMLIASAAFAVNPGSNTTTTGQTLNIQIDSPVDGSTVPAGALTVTGKTAIGPLAASANAYYMLDVSGSTASPDGLDCDGNGTAGDAGDDLNADGNVGDVLDCEISGVIALNASLGTGAVDVGLGAFSSGGANGDVTPAGGDDLFTTPPGADLNSNGTPDIEEVARSVQNSIPSIGEFTPKPAGGGGTDFDDALDAINTAFTGTTGTNVAFLLTDGFATVSTGPGSPLEAAVTAGTTVFTFSVGGGGVGCGAGSELVTIATDTGGTCTEVIDPSDLVAAIGGVTPAGIDTVEVSVNGGTPVLASLDALGNWTANVTVGAGASTIAATVTATDGTTATADITVNTGVPGPEIVVKINKDGGPMCADRHRAVRVTLVVRPRVGTTVVGVTDPVMRLTRIEKAPRAWLVHLKADATTIPAHTATVVVGTSSGDQSFTVPIPAFTCR